MSLRVDVGGDATGFHATLQQSRNEAKKFAQEMQSTSARAGQQAGSIYSRNVNEFSKKDIRTMGKATGKGLAAAEGLNAVAGYASPEVAGAVSGVTGAFFSLTYISKALGVSLLKVSGAAATIGFGLIQTGRLMKENYDLWKASKAETTSQQQDIAQSKRTVAAYDKAIGEALKNRTISDKDATRLRVGIRSNDYNTQRAAFREVRGFATGGDPELQKELRRAQVDNIADERKREIALARLEYSEKIRELAEKRKTATQMDKRIIDQTAAQLQMGLGVKVGKINSEYDKKAADEAERKRREGMAQIVKPRGPEMDTFSQVGLFTRQFLNSATMEDTAKKQLSVLKNIERNTKPATSTATNPFV